MDLVAEKLAELEQRRDELKPLVLEAERLEAAIAALKALGNNGSAPAASSSRTSKPPARKSAAPKRSKPAAKPKSTAKRGRPKGSGSRGKQVLEILQNQGPKTIPELAALMGIKQNYLYRLMPELQQQGKVARNGETKQWRRRIGAEA